MKTHWACSLVLAIACGGATAPDIPEFLGADCVSTTPLVTRSPDGSAIVKLYYNAPTFTGVVASNGHEQQLRACRTRTCSFGPLTSQSTPDDQLIATCQAIT